ncbi:MAG: hypothetical protein D6795_09815 [Deltaproteobacteria bacterium]|nr:MAG: hypothetical protein D6795_09815 [Deltaproteobacteria bacterium]
MGGDLLPRLSEDHARSASGCRGTSKRLSSFQVAAESVETIERFPKPSLDRKGSPPPSFLPDKVGGKGMIMIRTRRSFVGQVLASLEVRSVFHLIRLST